MHRRVLRPWLLAAATLALAACGTGVHEHAVEVSLSDPSGRLGAGPWEVAVFDGRMGRSEEWARKTTGTVAAGAPWRTTFSTVDTVTLGMARPAGVELWIYLPALERRGFFHVRLDPQARPSALVAGAFGSFGEPVPAAEVPALGVRYTATAREKGWRLELTLEVPDGPPTAAAAPFDPRALLPEGGVLVETARLASGGPPRDLVLWMLSPSRHPRETPGEPYNCPEATRGHYLSGPARLSLVDPIGQRLVDTVEVRSESEGDAFDLPYLLAKGQRYPVPKPGANGEGKPTLLALRDLTGDGKALEVAFYEAEACMGLSTAAYGYVPARDRLATYPVEVVTREDGIEEKATLDWADYVFAKEPVAPGTFRFEVDYSGRGGCREAWDVRWDPARELFAGTLTKSGCGE